MSLFSRRRDAMLEQIEQEPAPKKPAKKRPAKKRPANTAKVVPTAKKAAASTTGKKG